MDEDEDADNVEDNLALIMKVKAAFDAQKSVRTTVPFDTPPRPGPLDEQAELERQANGWACHWKEGEEYQRP